MSNGPFLEMFSDLDVGSNGGTPAPPAMHEQHHQMGRVPSTSHLSPSNYPQHVQSHSPDGLAGQQAQQLHSPSEGDGGYPSPSSVSTISVGSNNSPHTNPHDTSNHQHNGGNVNGRQAQGHVRTNTSSELAYALSGEPEVPSHAYGHNNTGKDELTQLQYPVYSSEESSMNNMNGMGEHRYAPEQDYSKGQVAHFPTVYEGYVYSPDGHVAGTGENSGNGPMDGPHATGAIQLSHMCVPASEGLHFMGGYMQYS